MRILKILSTTGLVITLVLSPVSFQGLFSIFQAEASEEIVGYQEWTGEKIITQDVIVKPGATLVIGKGAKIIFSGMWLRLRVQGNLYVKGTVTKPVSISSSETEMSSFSISSETGSNVMIRNAEISQGGMMMYLVQATNTAMASDYEGAIEVGGGTVDIQNTTFKQNKLAVVVPSETATVRVNRSRFVDNEFDVEAQVGHDFRYNWWGSPDGPQQTCYYYRAIEYCYYEKIDGVFDHSNQLSQATFRDPVIIIPGIMGSWKTTQKSDLELDPVFGTYDELIETLEKNGYKQGENLFTFPYEWHASNVESAKLLQAKIDEVKMKTNWPKVDIVAHSMGGLVAREYIETLNGGGNIDQLVTLGTPHNGSPVSYLVWESGEFYDNSSIRQFFLNKIFQQEAEENGYENTFQYLRGVPIASVRELLPVYSYIRERNTHNLRTYPDLYPRNIFLENLKTTANIAKLIPVELTNFVGKTGDDDTIENIRVDGASIKLLNDPEKTVLWGHGEPDGYDNWTGDRGLELGLGDGTVPIDSAEDISADETIEVDSDHGSLPDETAKMVVKMLTSNDALPSSMPLPVPTTYFLFMPFSPIDIQIISPSNKHIGKNFSTGEIYDEIPGAYYTGYDTKNEFIMIPNPEDGKYRILTEGTDDGEYRIEATKMSKRNDSREAIASTATVRGMTTLGTTVEHIVAVAGDTVTSDEETDTTAPVTTHEIAGAQGTNDWYIGDTTITLTAQDNENGSGVDKTEYSLDNGTTWQVYTDSVVIAQEGTTALSYRSTDKQGNTEDTNNSNHQSRQNRA